MMSKAQPEIKERQCRICDHVYSTIEFDTCPVCEEMHNLSKDFLNTTDDAIDPPEYNIQ